MNYKALAEFVYEQLAPLGDIRYIPMMGGYVFYYRGKIFGGIYEDGMMVKQTKTAQAYMPDAVATPPYPGAKPMLPVTVLEEGDRFRQMVADMFEELPANKPKKRK